MVCLVMVKFALHGWRSVWTKDMVCYQVCHWCALSDAGLTQVVYTWCALGVPLLMQS